MAAFNIHLTLFCDSPTAVTTGTLYQLAAGTPIRVQTRLICKVRRPVTLRLEQGNYSYKFRLDGEEQTATAASLERAYLESPAPAPENVSFDPQEQGTLEFFFSV